MNELMHGHFSSVISRMNVLVFLSFLQDRSIAVWDMVSPTEINLRRVLVGHRAAVNVVDFDEKYIVSASGDRTIKVSNMLLISIQYFKTVVMAFLYLRIQ